MGVRVAPGSLKTAITAVFLFQAVPLIMAATLESGAASSFQIGAHLREPLFSVVPGRTKQTEPSVMTALPLSDNLKFLVEMCDLINVGVGVHDFQCTGTAKRLLHVGNHTHPGITVDLKYNQHLGLVSLI